MREWRGDQRKSIAKSLFWKKKLFILTRHKLQLLISIAWVHEHIIRQYRHHHRQSHPSMLQFRICIVMCDIFTFKLWFISFESKSNCLVVSVLLLPLLLLLKMMHQKLIDLINRQFVSAWIVIFISHPFSVVIYLLQIIICVDWSNDALPIFSMLLPYTCKCRKKGSASMEFDASNRLCFMCAQLSGDPLRLTNWIIYLFKVQVTFDAVSGSLTNPHETFSFMAGVQLKTANYETTSEYLNRRHIQLKLSCKMID